MADLGIGNMLCGYRRGPRAEIFRAGKAQRARTRERTSVRDRREQVLQRGHREKDQARGHSSAGRAPALQAGGRRFDPAWLHHDEVISG